MRSLTLSSSDAQLGSGSAHGLSLVEGQPEIWALGPKKAAGAVAHESGKLIEKVGEGKVAELKALCGR